MRLFKSLLLTLLVVGTLNSCNKDDGGGSDDSTDNSGTTQPNYTVAAVNMPYHSYYYTITKESNNLEVFTGKNGSVEDLIGEITYDSKGSPSGYYSNGIDIPIKTKDKLITEITIPNEVNQSNYQLISKNDNTYIYGAETEYNEDGDNYIAVDGDIIRIFPEVDSIFVIRFAENHYNEKVILYYDSFGMNYRKNCKSSLSINFLNLSETRKAADPDGYPEGTDFYYTFCISNILDNMGATYFIKSSGTHKDYKVTFNEKNLPVRVDGILNRRIWTATYQ